MKHIARDVRQIKLITGEELLAEVVGEDREEYLLNNPLKILKEKMIIQGAPRELNFFTRWMGLADNQEFLINRRHIVAEAIVGHEVLVYYNKMMDNNSIDDQHMASVKDLPHRELVQEASDDMEEVIEEVMEEKEKSNPTYH